MPFAVALKTGTLQGYRDAWTVEWSHDYVVGVWLGRADAGTMTALSGGRAAAGLAQAVMLRLHGVGHSDLLAGEFAAPSGRQQTLLCTRTGDRHSGTCPQQLAEWVHPKRTIATTASSETRLAIVQPDPNTQAWQNQDTLPAPNRLLSRAQENPQRTLVPETRINTADDTKKF